MDDILKEKLEWYRNRSNNGRGRITGATKKLLDGGYLTRINTSMYCWVLVLSAKGKREIGA